MRLANQNPNARNTTAAALLTTRKPKTRKMTSQGQHQQSSSLNLSLPSHIAFNKNVREGTHKVSEIISGEFLRVSVKDVNPRVSEHNSPNKVEKIRISRTNE
jgi:hypothetical protein